MDSRSDAPRSDAPSDVGQPSAGLHDRLAAWVAADLISADQADRIAEHERAHTVNTTGPPERAAGRRRGRGRSVTSPAEAIGYVGAALALGAIALILSDLWLELLVAGRLALVGVLTLALLGGGLALRDASSPAMQRLTSVLLAASVLGVGWFALVVASDLVDLGDPSVGVTVGVAMLVAGVPLYAWKRRLLLQLVVLGSVLLTAVSSLRLIELTPGPEWFGLVIGTVGGVWFLLGIGRWLAPRLVAEVAGALVAFLGVQVASFDTARLTALVIGLVLAAGLVALAVRSDELHHLVIGALALFVFSPQLVFELFGDAIGAPATLLLVGLLLVLLAVGLGRARREVVREDALSVKDGP